MSDPDASQRRRSRRALVLGVAAVALLSGGAAWRASRSPRLVPVPLISQSSPWTCGPAALMAVLVYFGVFDDAESVLDEELGATPEEGTPVASIVAVARRHGLTAEARTDLTLDDLDGALSRGRAVIVALQAWPDAPVTDWRSRWEDGHYVVVVGLTGERVYVMDPSVRTGYAYLPRGQFLDRWHDYDRQADQTVVWNRLGIVIGGSGGSATIRPSRPPSSNELVSRVGALYRAAAGRVRWAGRFEQLPLEGNSAKFDLTLTLQDSPRASPASSSTAPTSSSRRPSRACMGHFRVLLEAIVARPETAAREPAPAHRGRSASGCWWSGTTPRAGYPRDACLHHALRGPGPAHAGRHRRRVRRAQRSPTRAGRARQPARAPPAALGVGPDSASPCAWSARWS